MRPNNFSYISLAWKILLQAVARLGSAWLNFEFHYLWPFGWLMRNKFVTFSAAFESDCLACDWWQLKYRPKIEMEFPT